MKDGVPYFVRQLERIAFDAYVKESRQYMKPSVYLSMTSEWTSARDRLIAPDEAHLILADWIGDSRRKWWAETNFDESMDLNLRVRRMALLYTKIVTNGSNLP